MNPDIPEPKQRGHRRWRGTPKIADMGMLIARTDPDLPKHQGISYFAFNMKQDGVDVRPLTEMTGRALFNEVFITDAQVHDNAMIGGKSNGWRVANATLMFERSHLGSGTVPVTTTAPGSIAGQLERKVGEVISASRQGSGDSLAIGPKLFERLAELAQKLGASTQLYTIDSLYGHDAFLKEVQDVGAIVRDSISFSAREAK